jgi:hypothetical protein
MQGFFKAIQKSNYSEKIINSSFVGVGVGVGATTMLTTC